MAIFVSSVRWRWADGDVLEAAKGQRGSNARTESGMNAREVTLLPCFRPTSRAVPPEPSTLMEPVEPIRKVQCAGQPLLDRGQVRTPHDRTDMPGAQAAILFLMALQLPTASPEVPVYRLG